MPAVSGILGTTGSTTQYQKQYDHIRCKTSQWYSEQSFKVNEIKVFYSNIKTVYYSETTSSSKYPHKLLCPCATDHIALYVKMNKHQLGVSHRRGGSFYRLYFITLCHLHRGMLIASCDYLHI